MLAAVNSKDAMIVATGITSNSFVIFSILFSSMLFLFQFFIKIYPYYL